MQQGRGGAGQEWNIGLERQFGTTVLRATNRSRV